MPAPTARGRRIIADVVLAAPLPRRDAEASKPEPARSAARRAERSLRIARRSPRDRRLLAVEEAAKRADGEASAQTDCGRRAGGRRGRRTAPSRRSPPREERVRGARRPVDVGAMDHGESEPEGSPERRDRALFGAAHSRLRAWRPPRAGSPLAAPPRFDWNWDTTSLAAPAGRRALGDRPARPKARAGPDERTTTASSPGRR